MNTYEVEYQSWDADRKKIVRADYYVTTFADFSNDIVFVHFYIGEMERENIVASFRAEVILYIGRLRDES